MSRRIGGVIAVRLLVVICALGLPIYFALLFAVSPYKIYQYPFPIDPNLAYLPFYQSMIQAFQFFNTTDYLMNYVVAPISFSLPWLLFIVINRTRLANTFSTINSSTTLIPLRYRIFYGFNTLIVILFFILPTISPILGIFAGIILAGRIVTMSDWVWKASRATRVLYTSLLVLMICPLPIYTAYVFYSEQIFALLANWIWGIWTNLMVMVYVVAMCIVDSLAVGSIIWLVFAGAGEFEAQTYGIKMTEVPYKLLAIFQFIVFLILDYLTLPYVYLPGVNPSGYITWGGDPELLFNYINYACLGIIGFVTLICLVKGLQRGTGFNPSLVGFVFAGSFLGVDYFTGRYIIQLATVPKYLSLYLYTIPDLVVKWVPYQYWSNLYIPVHEIPKIFTYFYIDTGNPTYLNLAYQIWHLIQTNSIIMTTAVLITVVLWFLVFIWSFARSSSTEIVW